MMLFPVPSLSRFPSELPSVSPLLRMGSVLLCDIRSSCRARACPPGHRRVSSLHRLSSSRRRTVDIPHQRNLQAAQLPEPTLDWKGWKRGYTTAKSGKHHATYPYGPDPQWEKDFLYSDPIHIYSRAFFTRRDFPEGIEGRWDGLTLCIPQGWSTGYFTETLQKFDITVTRPASMETCLHMVKNKRADLVSDDVLVMAHMMKKVLDSPIPYQIRVSARGRMALFSSHQPQLGRRRRLSQKFNTGLAGLRASGGMNV